MASRDESGGEKTPAPVASSADDIALICGPSRDGTGLSIVRHRKGRLEAGEVKPLEEGKPITGDVVSLKPRPEFPRLCQVETHYEHSPAVVTRPTSAGPAQVASKAYRANWESIYRSKNRSTELN